MNVNQGNFLFLVPKKIEFWFFTTTALGETLHASAKNFNFSN